MDALLPLLETVTGPEHPGTLIPRYLRAEILTRLGRDDEAVIALQAVLPRITARLPANHKRVKEARRLWERLKRNKSA